MWKFNILFLLIVALCVNISRADGSEEDLCKKGKNQSPIDLDESTAKSADKELRWNYPVNTGESNMYGIFNISEDFGVLFPYENDKQQKKLKKYSVNLGGMPYELRSMMVTWPSQHHINGESYDVEVQVTYTQDENHHLIVSYPMKICENERDNAMNLDPFVEAEDGEDEFLNPSDYVNEQFCSWFTYEGSLTTPPCTESYTWLVFDPNDAHAYCVEKSEYEKLKNLEVNGNQLSIKQRPLQNLNGREVEYNKNKCSN